MLWRQWSALGIQSHIRRTDFPIDIEALLISTFKIAPNDKRLFHAMLEWLEINRSFVSLSRIKSILKVFTPESADKQYFKYTDLLIQILKEGSFKSDMIQDNTDHPYYEILREYSRRSIVQEMPFNNNQLIQLKLRGIFGVNARADIILYLLSERKQNANKIAKEIYYDQKIVHRVLKNWEMSEFVRGERSANEILYSLNNQSLLRGVGRAKNRGYIDHPFVFFTLGRIVSVFHSHELQDDPYLISSRLRAFYRDIEKLANYVGLKLGNEANYPGEELLFSLQKKIPEIIVEF